MSMLLVNSKNAWNDYFEGTVSPNLSSQTFSSTQTLSGTNVYVSNCLFSSITSSGHGGALSCTSASYFLVESSSFFTCKTSVNYGGAIYFDNSGSGQSVLHKLCGYDCCSTYTGSSDGQFVRIFLKNAVSIKNYVNYSSISRCVNEYSNSHYTLFLRYGKIYCQSVNSSMNECQWYSGITTWPFTDSNSFTCSLSHSTIADNIANGYSYVGFWMRGSKHEIKSCNIIRNTQSSFDSRGTIDTDGYLTIEDSCILENKANRIFHQVSSYAITLSNCTVDSTSNNGYLTIKNTVTKSFIHALNHISTQNCHSEYDSAGTLTPNIQTPSSSKKQRLCYTYKIFFHQCQLSDFFSLTNVFIFLFIHPYASFDLWNEHSCLY
jgi:hypothetical protein